MFLDHRGQGRSDESTPERWNFDTWIEDLRGFCEALEIERPVLFGQSFGGMVALGTAIRHPELPGKLIVSSSAAKIRLDRALPMFERLGGKEARDLAQRLFEDPNQENFDAYVATCLPLYNTTKADPDILARVRLKPEVASTSSAARASPSTGSAISAASSARRSSSPARPTRSRPSPTTRTWRPGSAGRGWRSSPTRATASSGTSRRKRSRWSVSSSSARTARIQARGPQLRFRRG